MKTSLPIHLTLLSSLLFLPIVGSTEQPSQKDTIQYPLGLTNWSAISTSVRGDNNTQRIILGNSTAIKAARMNAAKIMWPEGTILAKLVWKNNTLSTWQSATVPGDFVHAEIMVKNSKKYAATGGWGFARWLGLDLTPHPQDPSAKNACFACHQAATKKHSFVFTVPAKMP